MLLPAATCKAQAALLLQTCRVGMALSWQAGQADGAQLDRFDFDVTHSSVTPPLGCSASAISIGLLQHNQHSATENRLTG